MNIWIALSTASELPAEGKVEHERVEAQLLAMKIKISFSAEIYKTSGIVCKQLIRVKTGESLVITQYFLENLISPQKKHIKRVLKVEVWGQKGSFSLSSAGY